MKIPLTFLDLIKFEQDLLINESKNGAKRGKLEKINLVKNHESSRTPLHLYHLN